MDAIRRWIRDGRPPPGAPLIVGEIAAALRVSATPVREALSRLAGEGLIEDRRGRGFFVPRLDSGELQQIFALHQIYVVSALGAKLQRRLELPATPECEPAGEDQILAFRTVTEAVFAETVRARQDAGLGALHRTTADRLAFMRRLEPLVLTDLRPELQTLIFALGSADTLESRRAVERYHARRIAAAVDLVAAARAASEQPDQ